LFESLQVWLKGKGKSIICFISLINKHEKLLSVGSDIEVLNARVKIYCHGKVGEPSERSVGHPKKLVDSTILKVY
jgi:hypothetical protein